MPFQSDNPIDFEVKTTSTVQASVAHIIDFHFIKPTPSPPPPDDYIEGHRPLKLKVTVSFGNDVDGYYQEIKRETYVFQGSALQTELDALVTSGKSRYDEIKEATYALLQAQGKLPAGTLV